MKKSENFYLTTPIYYVNGKPHIGHAYTTIIGDIIARYNRLLGKDVFYLTGTDEHGQKVAQSAEKEGLTPQKFTDINSDKFKVIWDELQISNNDFIRTTDKRHHKAVLEVFKKLKEAKTLLGNDVIYKGTYEGYYCVGCESYKTETDLVDGKCPDHQTAPEKIKEENWFFRLSDYGELIKEKIINGDVTIWPESRRNEVLGLIETGLKDVAMSRNIDWGVKLPFDENQVAWVWFDALPNYISALDYPDGKNFKKYWPADIHLMAKDILKFHTVIWLGMLDALKIDWPKTIMAHGFFTVDGQKMSKTIGNVIAPEDLLKKYGSDATRFLLLSLIPFGQDGDISCEKLDERYNSELANDLGNLVSRVFNMADKYFTRHVPKYLLDKDRFLEQDLKSTWKQYKFYMNSYELNKAIGIVWDHVRQCNAYIEKQKPWELFGAGDQDNLADVIYNLLESIRHIAFMIRPFMPETSDKIINLLNITKEKKRSLKEISDWGRLIPGTKIKKPEILFPRLIKK